MLNHLQKLVETAKETYSRWKRWVPLDEQESFQKHLRTLELLVPKLVSRKADFIQARIKKDAEGLARGKCFQLSFTSHQTETHGPS